MVPLPTDRPRPPKEEREGLFIAPGLMLCLPSRLQVARCRPLLTYLLSCQVQIQTSSLTVTPLGTAKSVTVSGVSL